EIREAQMETKKATVIIPRDSETVKQESPKISIKAENINKILSFASQALKNNETKKTESISQVLFNASINKNFERKQIFTESKSIGEKNWVPLRTQERTNDFLNIKSEMPFIPLSDIRKESSYIPQQKENIKDGEMTVEKVKENDKELPQKIQSIKEQPKNEKPTEKRSELTERQTTNEDIQKEMTVETTFEDMYERIQTQATQTESKSGNTVISDSTSTSRTPAASGSGTIRNTPVQNVPLERLNTDLHRIIEQKLTQRVFTESMDLQISPPNLGKVNLELIKTGMAISINVITETESSRESISRNLQNLVGTLRNEGYNPVQVNIKSENKNDLMQDNQQKQPNYKDQQEQKKDDSQEFEKILRGEENV
nr:flagellar hook-length control protein FliK [Petrotogaceae bacterium]